MSQMIHSGISVNADEMTFNLIHLIYKGAEHKEAECSLS